MQGPAIHTTARSFIDIPAMLLQSEPSGAADGTAIAVVAVVCALAAGGAWVVWRHKLLKPPREASGRLPQDALLGVIAMLGFSIAGTVGASIAASFAPADADYARLVQGASGNLLQLALALVAIRSALFVDAARASARPRTALAEGAAAFLLAVPAVFVLGWAINLGMTSLGFPPPPKTSHETLRILEAKGDILFTALTLAHVSLLVPLAEEAGWRGLLQPALRRGGLGGTAAALATAVLFAGIHWTVIPAEGRAAGLPMLVALGFALGLLRERTGGILAPVVLHAAFNALNVGITLAEGG